MLYLTTSTTWASSISISPALASHMRFLSKKPDSIVLGIKESPAMDSLFQEKILNFLIHCRYSFPLMSKVNLPTVFTCLHETSLVYICVVPLCPLGPIHVGAPRL
jgi:hypothetical protein